MENSIVVYFENGNTALFQNVSDLKEDVNTVGFTYVGVSTKTKRVIAFNMNKIAGMALSEDLVKHVSTLEMEKEANKEEQK